MVVLRRSGSNAHSPPPPCPARPAPSNHPCPIPIPAPVPPHPSRIHPTSIPHPSRIHPAPIPQPVPQHQVTHLESLVCSPRVVRGDHHIGQLPQRRVVWERFHRKYVQNRTRGGLLGGRWAVWFRHVGMWACGQVGRWAGGQVGRWAFGHLGMWAGGQVGRWAAAQTSSPSTQSSTRRPPQPPSPDLQRTVQ